MIIAMHLQMVTLEDLAVVEEVIWHLLVLLEDGLEEVLLVVGHLMVYVEVEVVRITLEHHNRILKVVTQEQLVDNIKVTDILR